MVAVSTDRSDSVPEEPALKRPSGSQVLLEDAIDIEDVFGFLDRNALFAGQWQLRKAKGSPARITRRCSL